MFDSMFTRSTTVGILMACPREDLAPLIAWMADRSREKPRRQRSQHMTVCYCRGDPMEANLLQKMLASFVRPPVAEITRGVKDACSTSLHLCSYVRFFICSCFL